MTMTSRHITVTIMDSLKSSNFLICHNSNTQATIRTFTTSILVIVCPICSPTPPQTVQATTLLTLTGVTSTARIS